MVDVRKLTDDIPADLRNEAATETYPPSPVDRSQKTLTDGSPVTPDHRDLQPSGQQKGYVVLNEAERAKGFVRPVRRTYVHKKCGVARSRSPTCSAAPAARRPARRRRSRQLGRAMDLVCINHWDRAIETHTAHAPRGAALLPGRRLGAADRVRAGGPARPADGVADLHLSQPRARRPADQRPAAHGPVARRHLADRAQGRAAAGRERAGVRRLGPGRSAHRQADQGEEGRVLPPVGRHARGAGLPGRAQDPELRRLRRRHDAAAVLPDGAQARGRCAGPSRRTPRSRRTTCWRRCRSGGRRASASTGRCKGRSIFGRKHALAPRTIQRIYAGAVRFAWPEPFLVVLRQHMAGRSIDLPMPTIAANGTHIGLAMPVLIRPRARWAGQAVARRRRAGADDHGQGRPRLASRLIAEPVPDRPQHASIAIAERSIDGHRCRRATTISARVGVVEPFVLSQASPAVRRGRSSVPLPTIVTGGDQIAAAARR
jgi:hypothetical protein